MNKTTFLSYLKSRVAHYKDHYSLKVGTAFRNVVRDRER